MCSGVERARHQDYSSQPRWGGGNFRQGKGAATQHCCPTVRNTSLPDDPTTQLTNPSPPNNTIHPIFPQYARFKFDKENEHSRRCPTCDTAQINHSGLKLNGEINDPNMTCVQCADEYCYYHSNSHVGISCEEYERKQEDVRRSEEQSDELATQSQAAKTTHACTFVQGAPPPSPMQ